MSDEQETTGVTRAPQEVIVKLAPESIEALKQMLAEVVLQTARVNLANDLLHINLGSGLTLPDLPAREPAQPPHQETSA